MSIFSKVKNAKKAADQHKPPKNGNAPVEASQPAPYKHIPTHAAVDAMSGAPSAWRASDRDAIKAVNLKRRSQMSRASSYISTGTTINRNESYQSSDYFMPQYPQPQQAPLPRLETRRATFQGYQPSTSGGYVHSPLASQQISPSGSNSSSSSQILELPPARGSFRAPTHLSPLHIQQNGKMPEAQFGQFDFAQSRPMSTYVSPLATPTIASAPAPQPRAAPRKAVFVPPPPPPAAPAPVQVKKRGWLFGRRSSAIAAH